MGTYFHDEKSNPISTELFRTTQDSLPSTVTLTLE